METATCLSTINGSEASSIPRSSHSMEGVVLIGLSSALSIACNVLNLAILPRLSELNEASRLLYVVLSVVDLLTGILLIPMAFAAAENKWPFDNVLCQSLGYLLTVTTGLSSVIVFLLNGDRFLAITKPLRYHSIVNRKRVLTVMVYNIVGTVVILFLILFFGGDKFKIVVFREFGICMADFSEPYFAPFTVISFAGSMWAYAVMLLVFYAIVLNIVRRHARSIANQSIPSQPQSSNAEDTETRMDFHKEVERAGNRARYLQHRSQLKSIFMTITVAGAFYIAWIPFTVCEAVAAVRGERIDVKIMVVVSRLTLCNSWLNTVIYMMLQESYRREICKIVRNVRQRFREASATRTGTDSINSLPI